jgi:hypothetical protein
MIPFDGIGPKIVLFICSLWILAMLKIFECMITYEMDKSLAILEFLNSSKRTRWLCKAGLRLEKII